MYKNNVLANQNSITFDATTSNITAKSDLGAFTLSYGGNRPDGTPIGPHALATISGVPTNFRAADLAVTYTDFKKIATLNEGTKLYSLTYGVDDQRRMSVYKVSGVTKLTRYYMGDYEEEIGADGKVRKIHYLCGAILIQNEGKADSLLYTYSDNQGSLLALTDVNGGYVRRYTYDPWGSRPLARVCDPCQYKIDIIVCFIESWIRHWAQTHASLELKVTTVKHILKPLLS